MYEYKIIEIIRVYDGDTITATVDLGFGVHKKEKFRLAYIDTPELRGDTLIEARISRDWLKNRLEQAQQNNLDIIIRTEKDKKGKYGRYIANIIIENTSVNYQMIQEGLAKLYKK